MELEKLETRTLSEEGQDVIIKGYDDKPVMIIKVKGCDSDEYARQRDIMSRKIFKAYQNNETLNENEEDSVFYANLIIGWKSADDERLTWGGKEFVFNTENAIKLLRDVPYIRKQVKEFVENRKNFFLRK